MMTHLLPVVLELTHECESLKDLSKQGPEEINLSRVMELCVAIKDAMQEGFSHGRDNAIRQSRLEDTAWLLPCCDSDRYFAVMAVNMGKPDFLGTVQFVEPLWHSEFAGRPCGASATKEAAANAVVLAAYG